MTGGKPPMKNEEIKMKAEKPPISNDEWGG